MKLHNFNSGPSILPAPVLKQAAEAVLNYKNTGLSLLEIGHRTPWFLEILDEARNAVKELMGLDDGYEVLFLHGGATAQFMQVPMNLLDSHATAAYCDNGVWGNKAWKEAGGEATTKLEIATKKAVIEFYERNKKQKVDMDDLYKIRKFPTKEITVQEAHKYGFIGDLIQNKYVNKHGN